MEFETLKKDNRKKWIVGAIAILAITSLVFFVSTKANYKAEQRLNLINKTVNYSISDLDTVAIKVQNSSGGYDTTNTVPTSGYTLSDKSYCEVNGNKDTSIPMEYKDGKVSIGITKQGTKCYLLFDESTAAKTLKVKNEMIHETFTNDSGELVDTGYRYEGKSPNNYVTFNNELWRIIGVFDVETTAGTKEQLVKLIRNESIGNISWDTYGSFGSNDWAQSDLKTILNGQYYNGEDINYAYRNSSRGTVLITGKSINDTARNMIENVKWNIGGSSGDAQTASKIYTAERGTKAYGSNSTVWNGYIGLMYASDYGYAVDNASCARAITLNNYNTSSCYTSNWLYNNTHQWTLSHIYSYSYAVRYALSNGSVNNDYVYLGHDVRPSLYLKSNTSIINNGNDGSIDHPYDLTM